MYFISFSPLFLQITHKPSLVSYRLKPAARPIGLLCFAMPVLIRIRVKIGYMLTLPASFVCFKLLLFDGRSVE